MCYSAPAPAKGSGQFLDLPLSFPVRAPQGSGPVANPGWLWDFFDELYKDSSARAPPPPAPEVAIQMVWGRAHPRAGKKLPHWAPRYTSTRPSLGGGGAPRTHPEFECTVLPDFHSRFRKA